MNDYGLSADCGSPVAQKTPDEIIRLPFEWAVRLDGEAIDDTTYELPDGLTNEATEEDAESSVRAIRLSGGTCGRIYRVICKVTTDGNRTLELVKRVAVREG